MPKFKNYASSCLNLIFIYQFGFRRGMGTNTALAMLMDYIVSSLDNGNLVLGTFLDFSKAFDTVDHGILLKKFWKLGICGKAHKWIESYLSNRKQFAIYNSYSSSFKK